MYRRRGFCDLMSLFKILHSGLKDLYILLSVDVDGYAVIPPFTVGHLAQNPAIRTGDSFNSTVGSVYIPFFIHGNIAHGVAVLSSHLAVGKQSVQPLVTGNKPSFSVRSGVGIYTAQLRFSQPG